MDSLFALPATARVRKQAKTHQRPFLSHLEALQKSCQEGLPLSNRDRRKPYSVALARPSRVVVDVLQILIFSIVFDVVLVARGALRRCRTSARRRSGYLAPASDISTFLYGRAESHSVVTKTPRSASSASSRSNSAFSLSGSLSANLRYLAARSWLMATHLPTQYLSTKPGSVPAKK